MKHAHGNSLIKQAEKVCAEHGTRLTDLRKSVLNLISKSDRATKAYDILDALRPAHPAAKPITVYRALDFLIDERLIHRIESLSAFTPCHHPGESHSCQFFICTSCDKVHEICNPAIDRAISKSAEDQGFNVTRKTLEVQGVCKSCTSKK